MKNMIQGIAFLARVACLLAVLSIPLYAQAKPVAKPAETAAPATTTAVPMPAPSPSASRGNAAPYEFWKNADLTVTAYGAFNYSVKSTFTKAVDSALVADGTYISPGFGGIAWYGNQTSQVGLSVGYMQIYSNTATVYGQSQTEKLTYIPAVLLARYYIMPGLWAGGGFGYSIGMLKADNGTSATKTFFSPLVSLRAGYDYAITREFSISGFVDFSYSFATINQQIGLSSATDYSANSFNIMPGLAVNYTF